MNYTVNAQHGHPHHPGPADLDGTNSVHGAGEQGHNLNPAGPVGKTPV